MVSRIALALTAALLALLVAELCVRALHPAGPRLGRVQVDAVVRRSLFERDVELLQRLRPGASADLYAWEQPSSVRVNSLGLRGPEPTEPPRGPRVLTLGDSFTLALQVDEDQTWPVLLQRSLDDAVGQPVEVINGGCDDYGTKQQVRLLERLGPVLKPDLVIVAFYLGNDLRDNLRQLPRARSRPLASRPPPGPQAPTAAGWSHLAHWVQYMQKRRKGGESPEVARKRAEEAQIWTDPASLDRIGYGTQAAFADLDRLCEDLSTACVVVIVPPELVVRPGTAVERLGQAVDSVDLDRPAQVVRSWVPDGLPTVDLTESLRQHGDQAIYLRQDGHWTPRGHEVVARALTGPVAAQLQGGVDP